MVTVPKEPEPKPTRKWRGFWVTDEDMEHIRAAAGLDMESLSDYTRKVVMAEAKKRAKQHPDRAELREIDTTE